MYFNDIVGHAEVKRQLMSEVRGGQVPHARLFTGVEGVGKLPLAVAYARYLCCENRGETDACGTCPSCVKFDKLAHPDLHFVFPVKSGAVSDDHLATWRELMLGNPYFDFNHWLEALDVENGQLLINVKESDAINRKLSLKSSAGGYKVMIVWLPEKMNVQCANKLLKLLEEPPSQTVFLLVSEQPEMMLETILSRLQRFELKRLPEQEIVAVMQERMGLQAADAKEVARQAEGSFAKALRTISVAADRTLYFNLFVSLMRLAYARKLREMMAWSMEVAALGRERQKNLLTYMQRELRENFIYNFHRSELVSMSAEEQQFSSKFAPFINERNVMDIMDELALAQAHVEQNVNPKMVFFDFALKMIMLLKG
ncbi:MAG: DNA polymerase III subunit delta' [Bacteroidaceae bacterium]|nr:DNA polymerase III subunit delta' [Bacteroidaceae bacterium]